MVSWKYPVSQLVHRLLPDSLEYVPSAQAEDASSPIPLLGWPTDNHRHRLTVFAPLRRDASALARQDLGDKWVGREPTA